MLLALWLPALGCAGVPDERSAEPIIAVVIVKPKVASTPDAVIRVAGATLGRDAGVRYARPMAGEAHLLYLTGPATREQVPALVERLRANGWFQYVELDTLMKIQ
jgi:hypothetical protein